jgi:hypothetical protein
MDKHTFRFIPSLGMEFMRHYSSSDIFHGPILVGWFLRYLTILFQRYVFCPVQNDGKFVCMLSG